MGEIYIFTPITKSYFALYHNYKQLLTTAHLPFPVQERFGTFYKYKDAHLTGYPAFVITEYLASRQIPDIKKDGIDPRFFVPIFGLDWIFIKICYTSTTST